ncbi:hypothetical protein ACFQPG_02620 [Sphingomonas sp. GCM10030256]|uniref:hypothetical protein n=1 Tax=Sphingomonas sp. GCM10030256 TaxID=3273427 RepID=UPI003610ABEE
MARLRVNEDEARQTLLVRAVEIEDGEALVLTSDDRHYATAIALIERPLGDDRSGRDTAAFLSRRAELATGRLTARYPHLHRVLALARWPRWLSWTVPLAALLIGLASNVVQGRQLNIVAFPLLGMLVWNLAVYLWLAVSALRRLLAAKNRTPHPLLARFERWVRPATGGLVGQPTLERGVTRFARDWSLAAAPLTRARASRTLHLGAALFAIGLLAGMLFRARYTADYTAGWAGTWAGAEQEVEWLLDVILGPASLLTGIALPSAARLAELRGGAENAGPWLILWAVTALLVVIVPRVVLALVGAARAAMLKRRMAVPGTEDFYVRTLLRNALGQSGRARVIPYATEPTSDARDRLKRLLGQALGERTKVEIDEPVPYGSEDEWLQRHGQELRDADHLILLFGLSSTPEAENHGAFATGVMRTVGAGGRVTMLIDDSAYRQRLRGQPSAERRLGERLHAWKAVLAPTAAEPVLVSLEPGEEEVGARLLERALHRSPVPA